MWVKLWLLYITINFTQHCLGIDYDSYSTIIELYTTKCINFPSLDGIVCWDSYSRVARTRVSCMFHVDVDVDVDDGSGCEEPRNQQKWYWHCSTVIWLAQHRNLFLTMPHENVRNYDIHLVEVLRGSVSAMLKWQHPSVHVKSLPH